jgi:hypothetical protein
MKSIVLALKRSVIFFQLILIGYIKQDLIVSFEFDEFYGFESLPGVGEAINDVIWEFDVSDAGGKFEK